MDFEPQSSGVRDLDQPAQSSAGHSESLFRPDNFLTRSFPGGRLSQQSGGRFEAPVTTGFTPHSSIVGMVEPAESLRQGRPHWILENPNYVPLDKRKPLEISGTTFTEYLYATVCYPIVVGKVQLPSMLIDKR